MMRTQLVSIRPEIPTIKNDLETGEIEKFQNQTLRPILKFQNNLILLIVRNLLEKHRSYFDLLTEAKQKVYVENLIHKDLQIHYLLIGAVIGHFTDSEYLTYVAHEKEYNRRITKMLIQRVQSQL